MKIIATVILGFLLLATAFMVLKSYYLRRKVMKIVAKKYEALKPLIDKFASGHPVTGGEILALSKNPSLRLGVYRILKNYKQEKLFPPEYFTRQWGAESFLVQWLEFPTELGSAPDHIEFLTTVTLKESEDFDYYVFKFIASKPAWASHDWMIGAAGPYREQSLPYDIPQKVFSRFNNLDSISPESEVLWIHHNINTKNANK
ncbi:MAG: hypothetical protein ACOYXT_08470 [Bacteroidota bacterium]